MERGNLPQSFQDVSERKLISDTQNFLLSNSYSGSGEDFFESLAKFLAQILKMDYVRIEKLEGDHLTASTVAIYNDGKFEPNITYSLKGTPGVDVVGKNICCFPGNVCELFPDDLSLAELYAESYIGTTLWSFTGKPIGLIAVIGRKQIENPHLAETILKLVAIRAAGELERKSSQEVIIESEERFRTIAETVPILICVTRTEDSVVLFTNEVNNKAFGFAGEEIIGSKGPDYYCDPNDRIRMLELLKKNGSVDRFQLKVKKSDGTPFWIMTSVRPIIYHGQPAIIGASIDITDLLQTEVRLRESEERLKYHLENSPLAVIEWDRNFKITQWSGEAERIFGLKREDVLGVQIDQLNIIFHEDIGEVKKTIDRLTGGDELKVISQNRNVTSTGQVLDCIWYNSVLLDENGKMSSVMSLIEDITLLRRTEEELRKSRESYKELVTNAKTIIIKQNTLGEFTFINEFATDFFGYKKEELLGKTAIDTIVPLKESTGRQLDEMVDHIIADPDQFSININENIKKNGEIVWVEWHNKAIFDKREKERVISLLVLILLKKGEPNKLCRRIRISYDLSSMRHSNQSTCSTEKVKSVCPIQRELNV